MRITVLGASGRIGRRVVGEALRRGHEVIAAVRDGSTLDIAEFAAPVVIARADAFDPAAVAAVVAGSEVVVSAVGHAATLDDQGYYVRAAESLVEALRPLGDGGPRLLVVGGFGGLQTAAGSQFADAGRLPDHAAPEILGQRDALAFYRTVSDVRWTYLSPPPGGLTDGERTGSYRATRDSVTGEPKDSLISIGDFAVAMVDEAERDEHPFACVAVANSGPPRE